jgi:TFIIS helical bundle-like domain
VSKATIKDSGLGKAVGAIEKHRICKGSPNEAAISERVQQIKDAWSARVKAQKLQEPPKEVTGSKRPLQTSSDASPSSTKKVKVFTSPEEVKRASTSSEETKRVSISTEEAKRVSTTTEEVKKVSTFSSLLKKVTASSPGPANRKKDTGASVGKKQIGNVSVTAHTGTETSNVVNKKGTLLHLVLRTLRI